MGEEVFELRVRGHLRRALGASPVFGRAEESSADAVAALRFDDVPAFDVADGVSRVAAVGVRAQAGFEEALQPGVSRFGDEDGGRENSWSFAVENQNQFPGVVLCGRLRPEGVAQLG